MMTLGALVRKTLAAALLGAVLCGGLSGETLLANGLSADALSARDAAQPPAGVPAATPPAAQDEFVPISEIPEQDKLPAAPFMIAAYTVMWLALLGYVFSLWRRLGRVEEELKQAARGPFQS